MGLFLAEPGSNPSKGVTWCYNRAHYDHVNWHNQLPTAKDILYEIHWYLSQLLLRNGIFFPDRLVKLPILHYDLEIINIHRQGFSSPRHHLCWRQWIKEFNMPPLPLQNTPPSATWRNESRWGRTASSLSRYVLTEQGRGRNNICMQSLQTRSSTLRMGLLDRDRQTDKKRGSSVPRETKETADWKQRRRRAREGGESSYSNSNLWECIPCFGLGPHSITALLACK